MISIDQVISELLLQHNCVVVPNFGGFIASQTSAIVDFDNQIMSPPRKSILFNKQLINNDGLLISALAQKNELNYADVEVEIHQLVQHWILKMNQGERIEIDKVGVLFFDREKNICFEQDRFFNLLLQSYGLTKIHFVAEQKAEEHTQNIIEAFEAPIIKLHAAESEDAKVIQHPQLQKRTKTWKYIAAAACILPMAFYSFWIPMKTDVLESGMISIKDFNPFYHKKEANYQSKDLHLHPLPAKGKSVQEQIDAISNDVEFYAYQFDENTYVPVRTNQVKSEAIEITPEQQSNMEQNVAQSIHFIVGCFSNETNATNLVNKLKSLGLDAQIQGVVNGLTRVSAGSANSLEAINQISDKVKNLGFSGWILK